MLLWPHPPVVPGRIYCFWRKISICGRLLPEQVDWQIHCEVLGYFPQIHQVADIHWSLELIINSMRHQIHQHHHEIDNFAWYTCTRKGPEVFWGGSLWRSYLPLMKSNWVGWSSHCTNHSSIISTKLMTHPLNMMENLTMSCICLPLQLYFFMLSNQICHFFVYISVAIFLLLLIIINIIILSAMENLVFEWRSSSGANLLSGKAPSGQEGTGLDDRS